MAQSQKKKEATAESPFVEYAKHYDILYQDKDYSGESKYISKLIKRYSRKKANGISILDLACGTGRHARELVKLGYKVDGSDISAEMVGVAKKESRAHNLNITFYNESFQACARISKKYDVVLAMFSAVGYLTSYDELALTLKNISSLMKKDGIFIFDFWNGNAVLEDFSPVKYKRMTSGGKEVIRVSKTTLDKIAQVATVDFHFVLIENGVIKKEYDERHLVRYFFIQEMADLLRANGLHVVFRCPFMSPDMPVKPSDWNVTFVVKRHPSATAQ